MKPLSAQKKKVMCWLTNISEHSCYKKFDPSLHMGFLYCAMLMFSLCLFAKDHVQVSSAFHICSDNANCLHNK